MHLQQFSCPRGHHLRAFTGFLLLGAINTVLPFLINTGSYLTIPFPRSVVAVIETAPAILVKLVFPHLMRRNRPSLRPLLFGAVWALATLLTILMAPNVEVTPRAAIAMLGVACAAAGEVVFLAMTADYGTSALSGWGTGTGLGLLVCAVWPYTVAFTWDTDLRKCLKHGYYLVAAMLFVYYVIIPWPTRKLQSNGASKGWAMEEGQSKKIDGSMVSESSGTDTMVQDSAPIDTFEERVSLTMTLIQPYIVPLALATTMHAIVYPGASRALGASQVFQTFISFSAAYGLAFQAGNLLARSSFLVMYLDGFTAALQRLAVVFGLILLNTVCNIVSAPTALFAAAFVAGLVSGAIQINVFGKALRDTSATAAPQTGHTGFIMGTISVGESIGLLIGGVIGALIEERACDIQFGDGQRWCQQKW